MSFSEGNYSGLVRHFWGASFLRNSLTQAVYFFGLYACFVILFFIFYCFSCRGTSLFLLRFFGRFVRFFVFSFPGWVKIYFIFFLLVVGVAFFVFVFTFLSNKSSLSWTYLSSFHICTYINWPEPLHPEFLFPHLCNCP